jgi:hypothetical protein
MDETSLPFLIQTGELQAAANALTSRILEHIRRQFPELRTTNDLMVQNLHEDRWQRRNTIAELERERSLSASLVAARRCNSDTIAAFENEIRLIFRYDRVAYHSHSDHPEIYEPVFDRFQPGMLAFGSMREIADRTEFLLQRSTNGRNKMRPIRTGDPIQ